MEYHGKLFGKIGNKYFDISKTSEDYYNLEKKVSFLRGKLLIATNALEEISKWDQTLQNDWGSPVERAGEAMEQLNKKL